MRFEIGKKRLVIEPVESERCLDEDDSRNRKIVEIRKQGNAGSLGYVSFIGWIATRVTIGADHTVEGGGSLKPESRIHHSAQHYFFIL